MPKIYIAIGMGCHHAVGTQLWMRIKNHLAHMAQQCMHYFELRGLA